MFVGQDVWYTGYNGNHLTRIFSIECDIVKCFIHELGFVCTFRKTENGEYERVVPDKDNPGSWARMGYTTIFEEEK